MSVSKLKARKGGEARGWRAPPSVVTNDDVSETNDDARDPTLLHNPVPLYFDQVVGRGRRKVPKAQTTALYRANEGPPPPRHHSQQVGAPLRIPPETDDCEALRDSRRSAVPEAHGSENNEKNNISYCVDNDNYVFDLYGEVKLTFASGDVGAA